MTFEEHMTALEKCVAELEGPSLSLEEGIAKYKEASEHLAAARLLLADAEKRLKELAT